MCIFLSQRAKGKERNPQVRIHHVTEVVRYSSSRRVVQIAFDVVIENLDRQEHATVLGTHPDNVDGYLATGQWRTDDSEHTRIVKQVYGDQWQVDWNVDGGQLHYTHPMPYPERIGGTASSGEVVAKPLLDTVYAVEPDARDAEALRAGLIAEGDVRLQKYPLEADAVPANEYRPYSCFPIGPIPPGETIYARLFIVIQGDAYDRLVEPRANSAFAVVSPERIRNHIENFALNTFRTTPQLYEIYQDTFDREITATSIPPDCYQVILLQSADPADRVVLFRPTNSDVSELYIGDEDAQDRALWFNAWSGNFLIVLKYGESNSGSRRDFHQRLPKTVSAMSLY